MPPKPPPVVRTYMERVEGTDARPEYYTLLR
jgi:hypothetical protein